MAQISTGSSTAGKANVDSAFNLNVVTPITELLAGFVTMSSEIDSGSVTGTRLQRAVEVSPDFRLRVGIDTPMFNASFEGTLVARDRIQQNDTTATAAQANGLLTLNSGNSVTTAQGVNIRTYRTFPLYGSYIIHGHMWVREANATATNAVSEWGFGYVSGVVATPTDGVFFRRMSGGQLRGVVNFNGVETVADIDPSTIAGRDGAGLFDAAELNHYIIYVHNNDTQFWINNILVAKIATPAVQGNPTQTSALPMFARVYNSGAASAARSLGLGFIEVTQADMASNKPWHHTLVGLGGGAYQTQPGTASGGTANVINSTAPVSATLSNSAAGYTTLGGQWQFAAAAGGEGDYALFAFQNPAGSATLSGKTLYITDIRIGECFATGAAVGAFTALQWGMAVGATQASLATTADAANVVAARRMVLGSQSFQAAAAIGTMAGGFGHSLETPIVVPPGCFAHITLKMWAGALTASLVFRGTVFVHGYFE